MFLSIFFYFENKKHITLFSIALLSTSWFGLAPINFNIGSIQLQYGDLALVIIFSLIPFIKKSTTKDLSNIKIALGVFLIFFTISILYDHFNRGTTFMQIFRTTRKNGYFAFLFIINNFSYKDYKKFLNWITIATIYHSIYYVGQYLVPISKPSFDGNIIRYRNSPPYLIECYIYLLFLFHNSKKHKLYILLLLITTFLTQSRGLIISAGIIILAFLYYNKIIRIKNIIIILPIIFIIINLIGYVSPVIQDRFNEMFIQFGSIKEMDFDNLESFYHQGSFIFRIGLTFERFIYILSEKSFIILGAGYIPDIDLTTPIFTLGTNSPSLSVGYEQLNTVDILFPNLISRYGIVGSSIFSVYIIQLFKFSSRGNSLPYHVLNTLLISMLSISFINETFYNGQYYFFIFILIGLIVKTNLIKRNPQ